MFLSTTPDEFSAVLRHFRLRARLSQNALARKVGIDASYINRIESGQREAPGSAITLTLARALALSPGEVDGFCVAAGQLPPRLQQLEPADSTVAAVLGVLTDVRLSAAALADFRAVVETIAQHWSSPRTNGAPPGAGHLTGYGGTGRHRAPVALAAGSAHR